MCNNYNDDCDVIYKSDPNKLLVNVNKKSKDYKARNKDAIKEQQFYRERQDIIDYCWECRFFSYNKSKKCEKCFRKLKCKI